MPEYRRMTYAYTVDQLQPELGRVIREHLEARQLAHALDNVIACCETITDRVGSSWYDGLPGGAAESLSYLALIVTPDRLIWARRGDQTPPTAASAAFRDLRVKVFRPRGTSDFGLDLNFRMENSRWAAVSGRLLLGPEPAAEKFCVALGEAMGFNLMAPPPKPWWDRLRSR